MTSVVKFHSSRLVLKIYFFIFFASSFLLVGYIADILEKLPLLSEYSHIHKDFQWQSSFDPHVNSEMCQQQQALIQSLQH